MGISAPCPRPRTHLALIRHLVGRRVLLHDGRSQHLEAPSELGQEHAVRVPWGQADTAGGDARAGGGLQGWRGNELQGLCGTPCAQQTGCTRRGPGAALSTAKPRAEAAGGVPEMCLREHKYGI